MTTRFGENGPYRYDVMVTLKVNFEEITGSYEGLTTSTRTGHDDEYKAFWSSVIGHLRLMFADIRTVGTTVRFRDHGS